VTPILKHYGQLYPGHNIFLLAFATAFPVNISSSAPVLTPLVGDHQSRPPVSPNHHLLICLAAPLPSAESLSLPSPSKSRIALKRPSQFCRDRFRPSKDNPPPPFPLSVKNPQSKNAAFGTIRPCWLSETALCLYARPFSLRRSFYPPPAIERTKVFLEGQSLFWISKSQYLRSGRPFLSTACLVGEQLFPRATKPFLPKSHLSLLGEILFPPD